MWRLLEVSPLVRSWVMNQELARHLYKLSCFKPYLGPTRLADPFFVRVCATMQRVPLRPPAAGALRELGPGEHAAVLRRLTALLRVEDIGDGGGEEEDDEEAAAAESRYDEEARVSAAGVKDFGDAVPVRSITGLHKFRRRWPVSGPAQDARDLTGLLHNFLVMRGHVTTAMLDGRNNAIALITYQVGQCCYSLTPVRHRVVDFSPDVEVVKIDYWVMLAFTGTRAQCACVPVYVSRTVHLINHRNGGGGAGLGGGGL